MLRACGAPIQHRLHEEPFFHDFLTGSGTLNFQFDDGRIYSTRSFLLLYIYLCGCYGHEVFFLRICRDWIATFGIDTISLPCSAGPFMSPIEQANLIAVSVSATIKPAVLHIRQGIVFGNGSMCHPPSAEASIQVTSSSWYFIGDFPYQGSGV